jgi:hypothetical protein
MFILLTNTSSSTDSALCRKDFSLTYDNLLSGLSVVVFQEPDVAGHGSEGSEAAYAARSPLFSCLVTMDKARNQVILRVNIGRPSSEPRAIDFGLVQCELFKKRSSKFVVLNSCSILWHFCWYDEPGLKSTMQG